jgi:hypothetical protein
MRNFIKTSVVFLSMVLSVGVDASLIDVVNNNRGSVVYINTQKISENTGAVTEQFGTGFLVNGEGYVLTAAHVVGSGAGFQIDIRGGIGSREAVLEGMEVLYENTNADVAVLRFKNSSIRRPSVQLGDPWAVAGDAVLYAMGFPGREEWFHTEGKMAGRGPKGSWNTTLVLNPGMSGGPIFDVNGKVVAMVWGGVPDQGIYGINRVIPINVLSDALRIAGALPLLKAAMPERLVEVAYKIEETKNSDLKMESTIKDYALVFNAKPGFKIVDAVYVEKSANNSTKPDIDLSEDKKSIKVTFNIKSGPLYDQYRGWLSADILTRQARE